MLPRKLALFGVAVVSAVLVSSACSGPSPTPDRAPAAPTRSPSLSPSPSPSSPSPEDEIYRFAAIRPSAPLQDQKDALTAFYRAWKKAFVKQRCAGGQYQVLSPDARYPFIAEAQGYGLVITASMAKFDPGAKTVFDGLLAFVRAHPSHENPALMAAELNDDCADQDGANSATDGDMDIAYGLLLADRAWGSHGKYDYRELALRRINAIKASTVHPASKLMRLGDWSRPDLPELYGVSRTSDWNPQYFDAFEKATEDPDWSAIGAAHRRAITRVQTEYSATTGLLPDFVQWTPSGIAPVRGRVLETRHDGDYHFNACRTPWRIGVDAITTGHESSIAAARKMSRWFRAASHGDPNRIGSGYKLGGERYASAPDKAFWTPLAVAAMTDPNGQPWLDALWKKMAGSHVQSRDYYGSTIQLQAMLVTTGVWTAL
jgi:endo-1,4-beta-D-glucanase Y